MKRFLLVALAGVVACSPGTVDPASLIQPKVQLHHLALRNAGLTGGTLDIVLAFHNPNNFTLKGVGLSAGLDIGDNHFGDVAMSEPFSLAGKDTTLVTVPLAFKWAGLAGAARSIINSGAVNYGIKGKVTINTPANVPIDVPFTGQGNVPLLKP